MRCIKYKGQPEGIEKREEGEEEQVEEEEEVVVVENFLKLYLSLA